MTHTYEIDEAMLGSEWNCNDDDDGQAFAECLTEAFAKLGHDVTIRWRSDNGGGSVLCPETDDMGECPHITDSDTDTAWSAALAAYAVARP